MNLQKLLKDAETSSFSLWLLNVGLNFVIPFNRPHDFKVLELTANRLKVLLPYKRKNFNHIRGIHACALATVTEFTSGLLLIKRLDPIRYRLIMQRLEMDYHYQGKMDAYATFEANDEWIDTQIVAPLREREAVVVPCDVKIHDLKGNLLTTGKVFWQVKDWKKVKTKVQ
jgi:acyl-coenzyme A thioesterase PaaI-like protein